jgi:hypothetical protein
MLSLFGFGKKRKSNKKSTSKKSTSKKSASKKPPAKLLRLCKKLKIKVTIKRGSKRVYKKVTLLKKLCKRKMKLKKSRKVRTQRKSRFGRDSKRFTNYGNTNRDIERMLKNERDLSLFLNNEEEIFKKYLAGDNGSKCNRRSELKETIQYNKRSEEAQRERNEQYPFRQDPDSIFDTIQGPTPEDYFRSKYAKKYLTVEKYKEAQDLLKDSDSFVKECNYIDDLVMKIQQRKIDDDIKTARNKKEDYENRKRTGQLTLKEQALEEEKERFNHSY